MTEEIKNIIQNEDLIKYFEILSSDYPKFIDKYLLSKELQRLNHIDQFCGCYYTKLFRCKFWYSRFHHSIACALMTWNFTKDKNQTLAALFHDLGTPAFSHCVDYLHDDYMEQISAEKNIMDIINTSEEIKAQLKKDHISLEDVTNIKKYPIVENNHPKICVDRLDGILHTGYIWCQFWEEKDIKKIMKSIIPLKQENDELELGFKNKKSVEIFYQGAFKYSIVLQQNEDKFVTQFISDNLKYLIKNKKITIDDLYSLTEKEIIKKIKNIKELNINWKNFEEAKLIIRTDSLPTNEYSVSIDCKKRYVIPLVIYKKQIKRCNEISTFCQELLNAYLNYKDSKYAFLKKNNQEKESI